MEDKDYNKIIRSEFIRFLKENGILSKFAVYFNNPEEIKIRLSWCNGSDSSFPTKPSPSFKDYCDKCARKQDLLSYAFRWAKTDEGEDYWYNLASKWEHKFRNF